MSVIIRDAGNIGPFKSIVTMDDRLVCDGTDYPFAVLGSYSISSDDSQAPTPVATRAADVPAEITMRRARLALLSIGKLSAVDAAIDALSEPAKSQARIEWEYSSAVKRNQPLVQALAPALGLSSAQIDALFIAAEAIP